MKPDDIVVVAARRTPIGAFQGVLSDAKATELGATIVIPAQDIPDDKGRFAMIQDPTGAVCSVYQMGANTGA